MYVSNDKCVFMKQLMCVGYFKKLLHILIIVLTLDAAVYIASRRFGFFFEGYVQQNKIVALCIIRGLKLYVLMISLNMLLDI